MTTGDFGGALDPSLESKLFRTLAAVVDGYVTCVDRGRRIVFVSRAISRRPEDVLGVPIEGFVGPAHRDETIATLERAFANGEPQSLRHTAVLRDGRERAMNTRVYPFLGPAGEPLALLLTEDVTERQQLQDELERSLAFQQLVTEHLPDFVVLLDREQRFVWVNRLAPGLRMQDVIGARVTDYITPESAPITRAAIEATFQHGTVSQHENEGYGDGVRTAHYLTRVVPVLTGGTVECVLMITSDITERRRAEQALQEAQEQLHQAQRMESIGQLAGGIAHDFNNLLQIIQGNVHYAQRRLEQGASPATELTEALRATERAAELTSHLLAIGRRKRLSARRTELNEQVEQTLRMLRRALPVTIRIEHEPPPERLFVDLDPPQFEQVLINLCVNARDAMPAGGTLRVRIEPHGPDHVRLSVSDTGRGIAPENLSRVFDPFFTTKQAGSGLGLAVAAGIIAAHGGAVNAESDGRAGTTIHVRLPRSATEPETEPDVRGVPRAAAGATGVILVAEDEELVRALAVRVLQEAGYEVVQAENGARAVEVFRERGSRIDLALLDVVMPVMDGWQAYLELERLKPNLKVLFTTGYAATALPQDFASRGAQLLSKPYKPDELLREVRRLLEHTTHVERDVDR
jgi:two-component system, cell cycle sensor histidine kinase and response regulator CckA